MLKSRPFVCARHKSWKCPQNFFINLASGKLAKWVWTSQQRASFWTHKSWKFVQKFFCKPWRRLTSDMRLNFTANSFIFGRTNCRIAPTTFSVKLAGRELLKSVWTPRQTTSFLDASIGKMRPELFFIKLERRKLPKCVRTSQQTALFLDTQIVELRPKLFCKPCR